MINYSGEENVKKRQYGDAEDAVRLRGIREAQEEDQLLVVCPECGQAVVAEVLLEDYPLTYALHWVVVPAGMDFRDYATRKPVSRIVCPSSHLRVRNG